MENLYIDETTLIPNYDNSPRPYHLANCLATPGSLQLNSILRIRYTSNSTAPPPTTPPAPPLPSLRVVVVPGAPRRFYSPFSKLDEGILSSKCMDCVEFSLGSSCRLNGKPDRRTPSCAEGQWWEKPQPHACWLFSLNSRSRDFLI